MTTQSPATGTSPPGANQRPGRPGQGRLCSLLAAAVIILTTMVALAAGAPTPASATPGSPSYVASTNNKPWLVLLCKVSGTPDEPHPPAYYQHLFGEHDSVNPTLWDYWWQVSNYSMSMFYSSTSTHWVQTNRTYANLQSESRQQKLQDCMDAAGGEVANPSSYYGVIAMWNVNFTPPGTTTNYGDSGASGIGPVTGTLNGVTKPFGSVVIEPWATFPSFLEHEMGHALGLEHSFGPGACEYCDPYDTMGWSWGAYEFQEPAYGAGSQASAGPGLDAFNLDKLGFIPAGRRADVGIGAGQKTTVTITSLSAPNPSGYLTIKIPLGDNVDHYYTVEYRRQLNWDAGLNGDGVLIHEVKPDYVAGHNLPLSYLVPSGSDVYHAYYPAGQTFIDPTRDVTIKVQSIDPATDTATVVVSGPTPSGGGGGGGGGGCGYNCGGGHPRPLPQ